MLTSGRGARRRWQTRGGLTLALLLAAQTTQAQGIDRDLARSYFAEAELLSRADAGRLWGVPLVGPLLFADRQTRAVVANAADPAGSLRDEGGVFTGRLPDDVAIYNGALEWGGQRWTMLAWPLPYGRYERQRLLAHELFHRLQPELQLPASNPGNDHLALEGARTLLRLEWRALQLALASEGAARRSAVADALRFRGERHRLHPQGAEEERQLEINEGLAEYTGVAAGVPAPARIGWAVRQLELQDARARAESIVRSFAYASGMAYGVLLEAADAHWTRRVQATSDLGALLAAAYGVTASSAGPLGELEAPYAGARLRAEEAHRAGQRAAQQAAFRARFQEGATLVLPGTEAMQYSFDPNAVVPFEGHRVFLTLEASDAWGTLRVNEGGAWLREEETGAAIVLPAPEQVSARELHGAGWTLILAEGWTVGPGTRPGDRVVMRMR